MLVGIRHSLRSDPAYGYLNATGDNDPWPIELSTSTTQKTHILSQHECNVCFQAHGDRSGLFPLNGGLQQGVN